MSEFSMPAGGYGRIWEHMYEGSLAGAGAEVFCLMPYIIAKMRLSPGVGAVVMLNPDVLQPIFGVKEDGFVQRGIDKLCAPDPNTKNGQEADGRRLVKLSGHLYLVVNGEAYIAIRSKERHADAQARYRNRQKEKDAKRTTRKPTPAEREAMVREERAEKLERREEMEAERKQSLLEPGELEAAKKALEKEAAVVPTPQPVAKPVVNAVPASAKPAPKVSLSLYPPATP